MDKQLADLDGKIRTLNLRVKKTDEILQKDDRVALERHKTSLESMATAVTTLKESIEEKKFTEGEMEEKIQEWAADVEAAVDEADTCMRQLADKIEQIDRHVRHEAALFEHKRAITLEKEKIQQQQEFVEQAHAEELAFEKKKLELKQAQKSTETTGATSEVAIMPKLVITKFDGTPQDWMRFWGQFETQIDKSSVPDVTKISYLKELLVTKVRNLIEMVIKRGKDLLARRYGIGIWDLLARRYGKTSEVVGTYVRNILELPTIRERDVKKIHEFYEVLLFNIESLQTLQSLNKLDAAVRFTFDKLGIIKNELAMMDGNWSEWSFVQFLEALEKWTINNPISEAQRPNVVAIPNNKREKNKSSLCKT